MDTLAFFSGGGFVFSMPCLFYPSPFKTPSGRCGCLAWSFGARSNCSCPPKKETRRQCLVDVFLRRRRPGPGDQGLGMPHALWPECMQHCHDPGISTPDTWKRQHVMITRHPSRRDERDGLARASERRRRPIVSRLPGRRHAAAEV
jgi:hypothetical protein